MEVTNLAKILYLSYFSQPATDRPIYRAIRRRRVSRILALGIGDGRRAVRMIEMARRCQPPHEVEFVGLDLFESRTSADGPGITLKLAHRLLKATGARVKLIPGDPFSALGRSADSLRQFDLVVASARLDPQNLAKAWFYVPGLLHPQSLVVQERLLPGGRRELVELSRDGLSTLAVASLGRKAA